MENANPTSFTINQFQIIDKPDGSYEMWFDAQIDSADFDSTTFTTVERNGITYPIAKNSTLLVRDTTQVYTFGDSWTELGGN